MLTETHQKNSAGQHSELFYWTSYGQFKSKMNLPLDKVSKIPRGALTNRLVASFNTNLSSTRLVATCHLPASCNLPKQFAASMWITRFDNQLATSLLTTCHRLVVNKLSQAMRMHKGVDARGDGGNTSPPIFGLGGTNI